MKKKKDTQRVAKREVKQRNQWVQPVTKSGTYKEEQQI